MVSFLTQAYAALVAAACLFGNSNAVPTGATDLVQHSTRAAAAIPGAPHFVVYTDAPTPGVVGPPSDVSQLKGYNTYIMGFWLTTGVFDQAQQWTTLTASQRSSIKSAYAAAGIKIMVSLFGSTDHPTSNNADPVVTANNAAAFVKQYGFDGVDVDYEDFDAFNNQGTKGVDWLIAFTKQLRAQLPAGQYIITHAPVAPWFAKGYSGGGYLAVHSAVGSMIDWYNIQFYNQGDKYTDCTGLLTSGSGSSLFEIAANGVDQNKLVIGKPAVPARAPSGGYMDAQTLASCVATAAGKGWKGGVMVWELPEATSGWIQTVRGSTFPISGSGPKPSPTSTTAPVSTSKPASPGSCTGVAAWVNNVAYTGGSQVTYNGSLWTAKYWTYGDVPGGTAGSWTEVKKC